MIVARQFIAWYRCENGNRPVGNGMIESLWSEHFEQKSDRISKIATARPGVYCSYLI
jgi:hypothetical protein